MEIKFKVSEILPKLRQVSSVVSAKSTLPILDNVVWSVNNGVLTFGASDTQSWIDTTGVDGIEIKDAKDFKFCLNAKDTLSVLQNLSGEDVTLEINDVSNVVNGYYGRKGKFMLPFLDDDEYPNGIEMKETKDMSIRSDVLNECIQNVLFSVANDELRPIMNTIHFDFTESNVVSVSSDGKKLSRYTAIGASSSDMNGMSFNLPNKPASVLNRIMADGDDEFVNVSVEGSSSVVFKTNGYILRTRLIDGRYPNYNAVIPQDNNLAFVVSKDNLLSILKRIMPLGNASTECIVMKYTNGITKEISLSTEDIDWSKSASESMECETDVNEDVVIGFKGSELIAVVQNVPCDKIKILIKNKERAALFVPHTQSPSYDYTSLMMPMIIA